MQTLSRSLRLRVTFDSGKSVKNFPALFERSDVISIAAARGCVVHPTIFGVRQTAPSNRGVSIGDMTETIQLIDNFQAAHGLESHAI